MTRKDYILIAAALKASRMQLPTDAQIVQHRFSCTLMADTLSRDNPRFERERFLTACGVLPISGSIAEVNHYQQIRDSKGIK